MNEHRDEFDETWFDKLDAIITGKENPSPEDDDLLHVAAKLSEAFSGINVLGTVHEPKQRPAKAYRQARQNEAALIIMRPKYRLLLRGLLTTAAIVFVLFSAGGACPASSRVSAATLKVGKQIWQAATSFEQVDASSVALLVVKEARVRPLLPIELPAGTQSVEFGLITDSTDPRAFIAFAADYRVMGQDMSVYERPANLVYPSSEAQNISIRSIKGQLFQDASGNSILQWYQDGMTCQIASMLPAQELVAIARQFKPITSWELIQ